MTTFEVTIGTPGAHASVYRIQAVLPHTAIYRATTAHACDQGTRPDGDGLARICKAGATILISCREVRT